MRKEERKSLRWKDRKTHIRIGWWKKIAVKETLGKTTAAAIMTVCGKTKRTVTGNEKGAETLAQIHYNAAELMKGKKKKTRKRKKEGSERAAEEKRKPRGGLLSDSI